MSRSVPTKKSGLGLRGWMKKKNGPELDVKLDELISGRTCSPITLKEFELFLTHEELSLENLLFFTWYLDYSQRFAKLPVHLQQQTSALPLGASSSSPASHLTVSPSTSLPNVALPARRRSQRQSTRPANAQHASHASLDARHRSKSSLYVTSSGSITAPIAIAPRPDQPSSLYGSSPTSIASSTFLRTPDWTLRSLPRPGPVKTTTSIPSPIPSPSSSPSPTPCPLDREATQPSSLLFAGPSAIANSPSSEMAEFLADEFDFNDGDVDLSLELTSVAWGGGALSFVPGPIDLSTPGSNSQSLPRHSALELIAPWDQEPDALEEGGKTPAGSLYSPPIHLTDTSGGSYPFTLSLPPLPSPASLSTATSPSSAFSLLPSLGLKRPSLATTRRGREDSTTTIASVASTSSIFSPSKKTASKKAKQEAEDERKREVEEGERAVVLEMRTECERVWRTFFRRGSEKELNLDEQLRKRVENSLADGCWQPDVFKPAYTETRHGLMTHSLPHFLSAQGKNINLPKQVFWYSVGLADLLLAVLILTLCSIYAPGGMGWRALRLISTLFASFGAMQIYSASLGFCTQVHGRSSRQLKPWELDDDEDDIFGSPRCLRPSESQVALRDLSSASFSSFSSLSPLAATPPSNRPSPNRFSLQALGRLPTFPSPTLAISPTDQFSSPPRHRHLRTPSNGSFSSSSYPLDETGLFSSPLHNTTPSKRLTRVHGTSPIFGPEILIEDPRVLALHKRQVEQILLLGLAVALIGVGLSFSIPGRRDA